MMNINNKGFTLIELIATIALLAIIAIISFVSINGVINQSKVNNCESLEMNIKTAAKEYVSDSRYNITLNKDENKWYFNENRIEEIEINGEIIEYIVITGDKLIDNHYLSDNVVNPFDSSINIDGNKIKIKIELNKDYSAKNVSIYKESDNSDYSCNKEWWNFG